MSYGGTREPLATDFSGSEWLVAELLFIDHNRDMSAKDAAAVLGRSADEVCAKRKAMGRLEKYRQMREGYPWLQK